MRAQSFATSPSFEQKRTAMGSRSAPGIPRNLMLHNGTLLAIAFLLEALLILAVVAASLGLGGEGDNGFGPDRPRPPVPMPAGAVLPLRLS